MKMKKLNLKLVLVYLVTVLFFVNCENNSSEILVDTESISEEEAIALIVNGFVKEVIQELPMECIFLRLPNSIELFKSTSQEPIP